MFQPVVAFASTGYRPKAGLLLLAAWLALQAVRSLAANPPSDYDVRHARTTRAVSPQAAEQANAIADLQAVAPGIRVKRDAVTASPRFIYTPEQFLTLSNGVGRTVSRASASSFSDRDPHRATKAFLLQHRKLFRHGPEALDAASVSREYVTAHNGLRSVVWEQQVDGIPVFEGLLISHVTKHGELVSLSSRFMPEPRNAADRFLKGRNSLPANPTISASRAVALAARDLGETLREEDVTALEDLVNGPKSWRRFTAPVLRGETYVAMTWFPLDSENLRLCWDVMLTGRTCGETFRVLVDADSGEILLRRSLTFHISNASYNVFTNDSPSPFSPGHSSPLTNQPATVSRTLVTLPALDTNASQQGWIPDGVFQTLGNNVDGHTDQDGDNVPDLPRPTSYSRQFNPSLNLTTDPTDSSDAAVVNVFYWCNWIHDKLYQLGFTEAAGNFQSNNFSRGGLGMDAVQADVQDGNPDLINNAGFTTYPDGLPGRLEMGLYGGPTPRRDSALNTETIVHECTHGFTHRRVGGGSGISWAAVQTRGMGEGWSDFFALSLLSQTNDNVNGCYAYGAYTAFLAIPGFQQNYYYGRRRYPYSTDMSKNPLTFKDIDPHQASAHAAVPISDDEKGDPEEVHNQGEVWCMALWEVRSAVIAARGFTNGNAIILRLVADGLNLCPPDPDFLESRDAILLADLVNNGGANRREIWAGFAKRGMGYSAEAPESITTVGVVESFDVPDTLKVTPTTPWEPSGLEHGPFAPPCATYTLSNHGTGVLNWTACRAQSWIDLSASSGALAPGASTSITACLNGQATNLAAGAYADALIVSNSASGITQSRPVALAVLGIPDLTMTYVGAGPTNVGAYSDIWVTNVVRNAGVGTATNFHVGFYFSADTTIATSDQPLVFNEWVSRLDAGETVTNVRCVWAGSGVFPGVHYLGAIADVENVVTETNESNNAVAGNLVRVLGADMVMTVCGGPTAAAVGDSVAVTGVVRNIGESAAEFQRVAFYLSTDSVINTNDQYLGSSSWIDSIDAGQSVTTETSLSIGGVAPCTYYLGAMADGHQQVPELSETNNFLAGNTIEVSGPDAAMTQVGGPAVVSMGAFIRVTNVAANIGPVAADYFVVGIYASRSPTVTPGEFMLGSRSVWSLPAGELNGETNEFSIPQRLTPGNYYWGAIADVYGFIAESNETNNVLSGNPFTVAGPDWVAVQVAGPANATTAGTILITNAVANAGSGTAADCQLGFYLSTDPVITTGDLLITSRWVPSLAPGQINTATSSVAIDSVPIPGTYYLGGIADFSDAFGETNEANNAVAGNSIQISIGPDFVVTRVSCSTTGATAGPLVFTNTAANIGSGTANVLVAFYLSPDTAITTGDILLGERTAWSLGAGQSNTAATAVTVDSTVTAGTYYAGAIVDYNGQFAEVSEANNSGLGGLVRILGPDLVMTAVSGPAMAGVGNSITITNTAWNIGGGGASYSEVRFYASTDAVITASDHLLSGSQWIDGFDPGQIVDNETTVWINGVTPGVYYLGAIADGNGWVVETNETNNGLAGNLISIAGSDLVATYVKGPATAGPDDTITVTSVVRNIGPADAGSSEIQFYLSKDNTITPGDIWLGDWWSSFSIDPLDSGQSVTNSFSIDLSGADPGTYYLGAIVDIGNNVAETNEDNNAFAGGTLIIPGGADLMEVKVGASSTGAVGGWIYVTNVVRNVGAETAEYFSIQYYLSADSIIDTNDTPLGVNYWDELKPGKSVTNKEYVRVDAGMLPGFYYVGAMADSEDNEPETNEINNVLAGNRVTIRGTDLAITNVSGPTNGVIGAYIVVTNTLVNMSSVNAWDIYIGFYLSADVTIETNDLLIGIRTVEALYSKNTNRAFSGVCIPPDTAPGSYYLGVIADYENEIGETNEANNARAGNLIRIGYIAPDLALTILSGPTNGAAGSPITVTNAVSNNGSNAAPDVAVGFYLSPDTDITTNDLLIGFRFVGTLSVGQISSAQFPVVLANTVPPGEYYLGGIADYQGRIDESNEVNNILAGNRILITSDYVLAACLLTFSGGTISSEWDSAISGEVYRLQRTTALGNPQVWSDEGAAVTARGSSVTIADTNAPAPPGFYRVLRLDSP